jgi:hypothetical protein
MTEPKRGRPRKAEQIGALKVKVADAIHDGEGGFLPVGATFDAADGESLKAKGLAE